MRYIATLLMILFFKVSSDAQNQNGIDFDGIDDEIVVANASALISGSGMSLGMWVYPRNAAPAFPNFDGFGGFRNDADADFYMVQIASSTLEARFRNSSGIYVDITFNGLILNQWQHLVFTYDGNAIKLYHNGVEVGNQPASGSIINTNSNFYIGNIIYSFNDFLLDGKVDEAVFFNKALNTSEINCLLHGNVDTTDATLVMYYNCNQGVAGSLNTGIDTLNNFNGQYPGVLTNFLLDGSGSNWVEGKNFIGTASANFCNGDTYNFNGFSFTAPGTYTVTIPLSGGCDSTVIFTLNQLPVDTTLTVSNSLLNASTGATAYQWVRCDNNFALIPGATQSSYNVVASGTYAVIVTQGNCKDTSRCVAINVDGIFENGEVQHLSVWPVPSNNSISITDLPGTSNNVVIIDETGRIIKSLTISGKQQQITIDIQDLNSGIYLIKNSDEKGRISLGKFLVK